MEGELTIPGEFRLVNDSEQDSRTQDDSVEIVAVTSEQCYLDRFVDRREQTIAIDSSSRYNVFKLQFCPVFSNVRISNISGHLVTDKLTHMTILKSSSEDGKEYFSSEQCLRASSVSMTEVALGNIVDEHSDMRKTGGSGEIFTDTGQNTFDQEKFYMGSSLLEPTHDRDMGTCSMQNVQSRHQTDTTARVLGSTATAFFAALAQPINYAETSCSSGVGELSEYVPSSHDTNIVSRFETAFSVDDDRGKNQVTLRLLERRKTIEIDMDDLSGLEVRHTSNLNFSFSSREQQQHHSMRSAVNIVWAKTIDTDEVSTKKRLFRTELRWNPFSSTSLDDSMDDFSSDMSFDTIVTSDSAGSFVKTVDSLYTSDCNDSFLEENLVYSGSLDTKSTLALREHEEQEFTNNAVHIRALPMFSNVYVDVTKTYDITSHGKMVQQQLQVGLVEKADDTMVGHPLDRKMLYKVSDGIANLGRGASDMEPAAQRFRCLAHQDCVPVAGQADIHYPVAEDYRLRILDDLVSNCQSPSDEIYNSHAIGGNMQKSEPGFSFEVVRQTVKQKQKDIRDVQFDGNTNVRLHAMKDLRHLQLPDRSIAQTNIAANVSRSNTGDSLDTTDTSVWNQTRWLQKDLRLTQPGENAVVTASNIKQLATLNLDDRGNLRLPQNSSHARAHYFLDDNGEKTDEPLDIYKPVNVSSNAVFNLNSVKSVAADTITTDHCITTEPSLSNGMYGDHCNINTNTDYEVTFMARGKSSFGIDAAVDVVSRAIYLNVTEKPTADLNASGVECKNYSSHTMTCKTNVIAAKYTVKEKSACDETIMKCVERTEQLLQTPGSTAYQRRVQDSMEISATEPCNGSTDIQRINESKAEMNLQLSNDNALERTEATDSFDDNNDGFVLVTSRRKTKLHNKKFQPKDVTDIPTDSNGDKRTKDSHNSNSRHRVLPCQIAQPASSSSLLACFGNKKSATITLCPNSAQNSQDETEVEKLSPMSVVSPSEPVHADIHDAHACNIDIACASIERAINGKPLLEKALPMHEVQCSDNNTELSTTDLTTAEIIFGPEAIIESFVFRSERKNSHERDTNGETVSKKDSFKTVSEDCISEIFISRMMEGTSAYSQEYGEAFLHSDKCGGVLLNMYTGGRRQILKPHSKFTKPDRQTTSRSGDNESDCTVPDTKLEEEQKSARHCTVNISDFNASAVGTLLNRSITKAGRRRGKGNKRKFEGISNVETSMPNSQISELNVTDDSGSIDASLECLEDIGNDFDVCMSDDDTDVNSDKYAPIFHQPDEADEMNQHLDLHVGEIMCASADVKDIDLSHNSSVNTVADLDTQDGLIYKESNSETTTWKPSVPIKEINDKKLTFVPYSADVELDAAHIIVQSVEVDTRCQNMLGHDIEDSFAITEPCDQEGNMLMPNLRQESFVDKSETFSNTYSAAKVTVTKQSDVASEHLANIREEVVTTVNSAVPSFDNIAEFGYLCSQSESSDQYLSSVHFLKDAGVPSYTVDLDTDSALTNTIKSGVVIETGQRSQPFQELVSVKSVLGSHDSSNEDDLLHLLDVSARIGTILIENDKTVHDYVDDNIQENTDKADGTFYEKVGNGQLTIADHEVEKGTCVNVKLNISDEYFQSTSDKDKKTWRRKETSDATTYNKYTTTVDSEQKVIQAHYKNRKVEDTENREIKFSSKEKIINLSDLILENCVNTRNSADDNVTITENVGWRIGDALWESVKKQERRDYPKEEIQVTVENTIDFFEDINENIGNDQWESDGEDIDNVKWESDNEEQHGREMTDIAKMSRNMSLVCKEEDLIEDGMYYRVTEIDSVKVVSDVRQEQDLDDRRREISDSSAVLRNYETTTDDMNWKSNDEEDEVKNGILNRIQENIYIGGHGTMDNIVTDNVEWKVEESCDVKWERSIEMQDGVEDVTVVIISSNGMRTVDRHEYFCEDRLALGSKGIDSVKCNIREKKNEGQGNDVAEKNQDDRAEDKGTDIVEWAFEGIGGVKWDRVEEEDRRQEYIDRNRVQEASNESVIHKIGEMRLDNHLIVEDIGDAKWQIDDNNRDGKNILKYRIQENTQEHVGYRIREKNEDHVVSRVEDFRGENWQIGDENEDERSALGYTIQESNEEYVVNIVEGIRTDHVQRNVDVKLERGYGDKEPKAKFIDGSKENRNTGPIGRGVDHNRNNEEWNVEDTGDVKWDVNNKEDDNHINNQTDEILLRRNQSKVNRNDTPETNNVEWRIEDVDYVKLYGDVQKIYQIDGVLDRTQENVCGLENSLSDNVEWRVQHFGVVKSGSDDKLEEPIRNLDDKVIEIRNSRASEIIQDFIEDRVECGVADTQLSRDIDEGRLCEIFYGSQETNKKGAISNICDIHVDSIQRPVDGINNNKCKSGGENKDQREDLADNIESFDASNVVCIKKTSMSDGGSCSVEDDDNMKYESYDEFEEQRDCLAHTIQETEHTSLVYATGELQGNTNQWRVEAANDLKWENDEENVGSGDDRPDTTQEIIEFDAVDRTEHCVGDNVLRRNDYISDLKWGSTGECEELKDNLTDRSFRSCVDKIRYVVAENTTSKIIDNVKLEYTLDDNEIINDPEDHTHENKVEVATDIEKGVKDFDLKLKTDDVDSENPVGRSGGNKELNDQNTVASVLASHNGHSIQQRDIVWSASSTKHTDNERNKQIQSSVIQSADNAITTRQPVAVGFTEAITNSSESTSYRDYINPLVEKFTCCNRSVNHHISINVDSSLESSGISHSAVDAVNTGGNVIMYAPVYVKAASPPTDIKVKITLSESKQKRKKIKKKKNMKYEKKNAQARALEQTANVKEPLGENPTASEVMGVAASSQQLSVHCCTDDSAVGASVGELTTLLVIGHVRQAEKRSGNTVTKPVDSLKFTEVCSICENTRIMETLNTTAEVENDKTESKTEQFVGKVEASHNGSITPANLCQLPSSDNFECVEYVSANKAEQWVHVDNSSCFDTTLLKGIRSASSSCREDHAIVSMDSVSEFQTDYLSHPFVERREIFLPPIHKPVVFKVPMGLSKIKAQRYTCLDCGRTFAQGSGLGRHRGSVHGMKKHMKKHCCLVCARAYTTAPGLNSHMKSHHLQVIQPEVIHQTSVDETLVIPHEHLTSLAKNIAVQPAQTPSSDTTHIPYEYSTSILGTDVSASPQLTTLGSTSSWSVLRSSADHQKRASPCYN